PPLVLLCNSQGSGSSPKVGPNYVSDWGQITVANSSGSQSLGTGVGVFWKGTYLILTAADTMEPIPYEQLH
ncbi:MAG: hypothetical protein ACRD3O_18635, partial [Terriglobia bacterium]